MADTPKPPETKRAARDEQLASALRANLRRRKASQARPATAKPEKKGDPGA